jgi:hypothetical protein
VEVTRTIFQQIKEASLGNIKSISENGLYHVNAGRSFWVSRNQVWFIVCKMEGFLNQIHKANRPEIR